MTQNINKDCPSDKQTDSKYKQYKFVICYCCFILLPIVFLIVSACYDKGPKYEYGQITITNKFRYIVPSRRMTFSVRGGGNGYSRSYVDYNVWAKTKDGRTAFIHVSDEKSFQKYQRGDVVSTRFTTHKKRGEWGWAVSAGILLNVWFIALLIMVIRIAVRRR